MGKCVEVLSRSVVKECCGEVAKCCRPSVGKECCGEVL